jgi:hypothetical protein
MIVIRAVIMVIPAIAIIEGVTKAKWCDLGFTESKLRSVDKLLRTG